MPLTVALPLPVDRHDSLAYEGHPQLGDHVYSPIVHSWTQRRQMPDGRPLLLSGYGRRPTDEQVSLFGRIDARRTELTAAAIETVGPPPIRQRRGWFRRPPEFARDELVLREVTLGENLTFELFFDTPTGDRIGLWPVVEFHDWRVVSAEWAC